MKVIYLDYHATTPCDDRVMAAMQPYWQEIYGNPHSIDHEFGWKADEAVEMARSNIAKTIHARVRDVYVTSGATEANNIAIKGAALWRKTHEGRNHIITLATEHKCVLENVKYLEQQGFDCTILPVNPDGTLDLDQLKQALNAKTALVSVMLANNEIGTIYPMAKIAAMAHEYQAWLHCDAAQGLGKFPIDVDAMGVDMLSLSSHKAYGPKGVGALFMRGRTGGNGTCKVTLLPILHGGGQEKSIRPGTLATPLIVGFGTACALIDEALPQEMPRIKALRDDLLTRLQQGMNHEFYVNGTMAARLNGNLHLSFVHIDPAAFMTACPDLAFSSGSACASGTQVPSHVLQAIGIDPGQTMTNIRLCIGRMTTKEEVEAAANTIINAVQKLSS